MVVAECVGIDMPMIPNCKDHLQLQKQKKMMMIMMMNFLCVAMNIQFV